eukprot:TRINITY_DN4647_c0_g1_i2.p1 TRINITY_DN4647_c0_g1~~TRINITY_DN4647_c0_g1_i2.p1  ORF type:complete len:325 (+),score=19.47 TRINITY_DN4647_c0_g1_i2:178-1152(+)
MRPPPLVPLIRLYTSSGAASPPLHAFAACLPAGVRGPILGLDVGTRHVGVALSDPSYVGPPRPCALALFCFFGCPALPLLGNTKLMRSLRFGHCNPYACTPPPLVLAPPSRRAHPVPAAADAGSCRLLGPGPRLAIATRRRRWAFPHSSYRRGTTPLVDATALTAVATTAGAVAVVAGYPLPTPGGVCPTANVDAYVAALAATGLGGGVSAVALADERWSSVRARAALGVGVGTGQGGRGGWGAPRGEGAGPRPTKRRSGVSAGRPAGYVPPNERRREVAPAAPTPTSWYVRGRRARAFSLRRPSVSVNRTGPDPTTTRPSGPD